MKSGQFTRSVCLPGAGGRWGSNKRPGPDHGDDYEGGAYGGSRDARGASQAASQNEFQAASARCPGFQTAMSKMVADARLKGQAPPTFAGNQVCDQ